MTARAPTGHEVLQAQVCDLLAMTGWSWLHVRRSIGGRHQGWVTSTVLCVAGQRMERGWPDLVAWSPRQPGRHLAIEVKVPPDKLRPEQTEVLHSLDAAGWEAHVVHPDGLQALAAILAPRP